MSKLIGQNAAYEHIVAYMTDHLAESELTDHEKALLDRWEQAHALIINYKSGADVVAILRKQFNISKATAYRDVSSAIALFGDINKTTKEGIKHLSTEMIRDGAAIARAKNNEDGLFKAAIALAKVNGANVTDPDLPDWSKLEPNVYEYKLDRLTERAILHLIKTGRIDMTMVVDTMQEMAETVDYEEIKDQQKELGNGES